MKAVSTDAIFTRFSSEYMSLIQLKLDDMRGTIPPVSPIHGCWIAGGAVRGWFCGEELSDVDVFGPEQQALDNFVSANNKLKKIDETPRAVTYDLDGLRVQTIRVFHNTPQSLLENFDFNVCQFAWSESGIFATRDAIIGTLRKHLSVCKITKEFAVDSLRRAFKYQRKGFIPCAGTIRDLANAVRELTAEEINNQVVVSPHGGSRLVRFD